MLIHSQNLTKLPVVTDTGRELGQVTSFLIDIDTQSIMTYLVKPPNFIKGLFTGHLEISRGQVIEITNEHLLIEDSAIKKNIPLISWLSQIMVKPETEGMAQ